MINRINKLWNQISAAFLITLMCTFLFGCHQRARTDVDTPESGTIHISVDESFKPVIDSEIQVFEALYPKAKIIADYKPEAECFEDLKKDSTRMIIVTRGLTPQEEKSYKERLTYSPTWSKVANDAIAVIVNKNSPDSLFTMDAIKGILSGTTGDKELAVFDGLKETSTIRYAIDSILKGKPLDPKKVFAEDSSRGVINYVANHTNVLGFVGVSWIGNPEDTTQTTFLKKVTIASIQCKCPEESYIKPYQANIMLKRYPMVRGLYYIIKENYDGLGSGFATFLEYERGQLIFRRAYLGPAKMNFSIRSATTN
jgi:phosphate transport system substrate-binding protein